MIEVSHVSDVISAFTELEVLNFKPPFHSITNFSQSIFVNIYLIKGNTLFENSK